MGIIFFTIQIIFVSWNLKCTATYVTCLHLFFFLNGALFTVPHSPNPAEHAGFINNAMWAIFTSCTLHRTTGNHPSYRKTHSTGTIVFPPIVFQRDRDLSQWHYLLFGLTLWPTSWEKPCCSPKLERQKRLEEDWETVWEWRKRYWMWVSFEMGKVRRVN